MSIMGTSKSFASLSSGLLARKGQARPAMRSQGYVGMSSVPSAEDLGWNDMGHGVAPIEQEAPPVADIPEVVRQRELLDERLSASDASDIAAIEEPDGFDAPPVPVVQAEMPAAPLAPPIAVRPVSDGTLKRIGRETKPKKGAKAAFTLRLDAERHLRLRLASAVTNRSAQQIVSDALDAYLVQLSELDALVERVPARRSR